MARSDGSSQGVEERFWSKVDKTDGCWRWTAATSRGHGQFWLNGKFVYAHRFSYELMIGPIPEGLQIDHLCRNRACVNPDHLEPVTQRENIRRGLAGKQNNKNAAKTECFRGHRFDDENTYTYPSGKRQCRTCHRVQQTTYRNRRQKEKQT